jgi:hypothetical protein
MMLVITGYSGFVGDVLFHKFANFNQACISRVRPNFIDCNNFISYDLFS